MNNSDTLAILGGTPTRSEPFIVEPMIDKGEEKMVLDAIREKNFSRYVGMSVERDVLELTSAEAVEIDDYWHFHGGPNVRAFAAEFAEYFSVPYAIPVTSATIGLSVALAAANIGPGDEVIVPALSFSATANSVLMFNSIPVFVDVDPDTFCIDPIKIEEAITPNTKAIMPVHLTGNVSDMNAIMDISRRHNLQIIEDSCQAIGAQYGDLMAGAVGHAGVFSFQQSKNIMTGEGGMIITHDPNIAARARLIINHGELVFNEDATVEDLENIIGFNFRMPELCAAVGRAQLKKLSQLNEWRTNRADFLRRELSDVSGLKLPGNQRSDNSPAKNVPHFFVALYDEEEMGMSRKLYVAALREEGIPVGTGYARPMYAAPTFLKKIAYGRDGYPWNVGNHKSDVIYKMGMCPISESLLAEEFLWLYHVAYPSTDEDMMDIVEAIKKIMRNRENLIDAEASLTDKIGGHSAGRISVAPSQLKNG